MSQVPSIAFTRRGMLQSAAVGTAAVTVKTKAAQALTSASAQIVTLDVNGKSRSVQIDPRASLLDTLREGLGLTGSKKGCDHGQCGACTVHVGGRRVLSCLTLAVTVREPVTTIEGLTKNGELHPLQQAFIDQDAFQCGYCTPGQIMSAVACIKEGHAGSDEDIREYMSGNLCRCAAYPQIVAAVAQAAVRTSRAAEP